MRSYVAISGPGFEATEANIKTAHAAGYLLGEAGHFVLTGGLNGVMRAAAAGCEEAGGSSIGFLPGADRMVGSKTHTILIPTGMGEMRNTLLVRAATAVVVIGGGWGTLSEVALAKKMGKPVIVLEGSELPFDLQETPLTGLLDVLAGLPQ